jgi:hypothetical protein
VNFRIIDEFRRLGVEFAYPTQRVVVDAAGFPRAAADPESTAVASWNTGS